MLRKNLLITVASSHADEGVLPEDAARFLIWEETELFL